MQNINPLLVLNFIIMVALQVFACVLLPRTAGFTKLGVTTVGVLAFVASYWLMSRSIHSGANLGILIPFMGAAIPLSTIAFGILAYGESASLVRVSLLVTSCILVGVASRY